MTYMYKMGHMNIGCKIFVDPSWHTKNYKKNQIPARAHKKNKKWYFRTKFHFRKAFPSTFSEENGHAEVGEKNSNNTFVLCTCSPFFYRWVLLMSKKTFLKIHLAMKSKNLKYKKHPHKKIEKHKINHQAFHKKRINHILSRTKISLFTRLFMSR